MNSNFSQLLLNGNHAVSYGAMLANPGVIPIYPITPQTPIAEKLTQFQKNGDLEAEFITPESEHSAMAACVAASLTGSRVFTATSSQGLLLMHELLHYASGARAPIVMANVNRTVASPWGFWPDHTDSLAQRDTGWIQYYTESPQESLDTVFQTYRTAEKVSMPAMVVLEAFYISHSLEVVEVPDISTVDKYLPPYEPEIMIDPLIGRSWGNVVNQETFCRHRKYLGEAMEYALEVAEESDKYWAEVSGRKYGVIESYKCEDAENVIVTMGTISGTAKVAVDEMRDEGYSIGLIKIKLFRPFPVEILRKVLEGRSRVIVLDRNFIPGLGGIIFQELKASLYGLPSPPQIYGYLAGVGGVNVSLSTIKEIANNVQETKSSVNYIWAR